MSATQGCQATADMFFVLRRLHGFSSTISIVKAKTMHSKYEQKSYNFWEPLRTAAAAMQ
jgi:hypothetical protein